MEGLKEITDYILGFLLGDEEAAKQVTYSSNAAIFDNYKLVVIPSDFFKEGCYATSHSLPQLPLAEWEGSPLLFGKSKVERRGDSLLLYADVVASSYFLISRYEEMLRPDCRDRHGRFPAEESLPFRAAFLQRPLVEEYGRSLRKLLREQGVDITEKPPTLRKIYLTHDVDALSHYRNLRSWAAALLRSPNSPQETIVASKSYFGKIENDPWYSFPWLLERNASVWQKYGPDVCETIFFIKGGGGKSREDAPTANIMSRDYRKFFQYCREAGASIGLHPSYQAGEKTELIAEEREKLEKAATCSITYSRNHYLRSREPRDMQALIEAGIEHDFTMGYAASAGFRLGTCRAVRFINPETQSLTALTLHPLNVMDISLNDPRYMALNEEEALQEVRKLIETCHSHKGELCLLWHNNAVASPTTSYHRNLYREITEYLIRL